MQDIAMAFVFILALILGGIIMKMTDDYLDNYNNNREDDQK